jgi:hypothetical protein
MIYFIFNIIYIMNNDNNTQNINTPKNNNTIKLFVTIFMFLVIMIIILLCLYYMSPSTFLIEKYNLDEFNILNTEKITMEPNGEILLDYYTNKNYYLKIKSKKLKKLNIVYYNTFKSQNVRLKSNYLLKSNFYADLKIINNSAHKTIVTIKYFTKKNNI